MGWSKEETLLFTLSTYFYVITGKYYFWNWKIITVSEVHWEKMLWLVCHISEWKSQEVVPLRESFRGRRMGIVVLPQIQTGTPYTLHARVEWSQLFIAEIKFFIHHCLHKSLKIKFLLLKKKDAVDLIIHATSWITKAMWLQGKL